MELGAVPRGQAALEQRRVGGHRHIRAPGTSLRHLGPPRATAPPGLGVGHLQQVRRWRARAVALGQDPPAGGATGCAGGAGRQQQDQRSHASVVPTPDMTSWCLGPWCRPG